MLAPWLPEKGLAMIFAPRGVGKTWVALSIAHAIASGGAFLRWRAPQPRRVLYIDGEMPAVTLQERYGTVVVASKTDALAENFRLLAADFQPDGLPDLADTEAQRFYDSTIADADLIIVDNLSTIARGLRENEADSFGPVQSWMLAQRAAGRSVLAVHHAGKGGGQRGTSRKEDTLDTVISLTRPPGYQANEGARFEVRFSKSRGSSAKMRSRSRRALPMAVGRQAKLSPTIPTARLQHYRRKDCRFGRFQTAPECRDRPLPGG